jgi:hypothetical protein
VIQKLQKENKELREQLKSRAGQARGEIMEDPD